MKEGPGDVCSFNLFQEQGTERCQGDTPLQVNAFWKGEVRRGERDALWFWSEVDQVKMFIIPCPGAEDLQRFDERGGGFGHVGKDACIPADPGEEVPEIGDVGDRPNIDRPSHAGAMTGDGGNTGEPPIVVGGERFSSLETKQVEPVGPLVGF